MDLREQRPLEGREQVSGFGNLDTNSAFTNCDIQDSHCTALDFNFLTFKVVLMG